MATLRYRKARDRADQLGQVFTPPPIATLLTESIPVPHEGVRYIVDLGAGEGALARAALVAYPRAQALLVELDRHVGKVLRNSLPACATVACADALGAKWDVLRTPSWILSNPPYGHAALTPAIRRMIADSGLTIPCNGEWVRGDAAFLARAWGLAQIGTGIGLIVASPIIRNTSFELLRHRLVGQMSNLCVTQLHEATFANAEVRAYLLSGMRAVSRQRRVVLRKADAAGAIVDEMDISFLAAARSLDIDFHRTLQRFFLIVASVFANRAIADKLLVKLISFFKPLITHTHWRLHTFQTCRRVGYEKWSEFISKKTCRMKSL